MARRCMGGLPRAEALARCCYLSWFQQSRCDDITCERYSFCAWLRLRVQAMQFYLSRRGEQLVQCGACTQCWYVCTDMLLDILFNTQISAPSVETETVSLDDEMLALVRSRRGHPLCDEFFLPKCLAHLSLP